LHAGAKIFDLSAFPGTINTGKTYKHRALVLGTCTHHLAPAIFSERFTALCLM
jgi:hypothetical protein